MFRHFAEREAWHRARAALHAYQGRPDYAEGSLRKAQRAATAARSVDLALNGPFPKTAIEQFGHDVMEDRAQRLVASIEGGLFRSQDDLDDCRSAITSLG